MATDEDLLAAEWESVSDSTSVDSNRLPLKPPRAQVNQF